jgi:drug/metabolite transporter (DMT)-like permease
MPNTNPKLRAFIYLHIAVFLWGFTAILGKLISYGSLDLVWHRMLLTAAIYFCIPVTWKYIKVMALKDIAIFFGIGAIVCAHWLTFYGSIKLGNSASVTLACLGTASFFSSILEPLITKKKFIYSEILLGILVVAGILLIYVSMPEPTDTEVNYSLAIITGICSAFLAALFTVLNKKNIHKTDPLALSALEMASGAILLTIVILSMGGTITVPQWNPSAGNYDVLWILILVILCTNLTFWLGSHSLKEMSAFTANLTVNLEPIYGIILGALIFAEHQFLNLWFYAGTLLILVSVFAQTAIEYRKRKREKENNSELIIRE